MGLNAHFSAADGMKAVTLSGTRIDLSTGSYFKATVAGNTTFTFSAPPNKAYTFGFVLRVNHTSGTITWPGSVTWPEGSAPTLTTGKTHVFVFTTDDAGSKWRGVAQANHTT